MKHAAIAIGSNSTRLLTAEKQGKILSDLYRGREETRLFLGLDAQGNIAPEQLEATAQAVRRLYAEAVRQGAQDCALFATSACRDAGNGDMLAKRIYALTGLSLRIISGEEEARLAFRAAAGLENRLVMDVGGGSTELTLGNEGKILLAVSAQMGASRLLKLQDIHSMHDAEKAMELAENVLRPFAARVCSLPRADGLIGLGGSCTTAAAMQENREIHGEAAEGKRVSLDTLKTELRLLSPLSLEERMRIPGLPSTRAAIMPQGLCILIAALTLLEFEEFTVSGRTNLDGYLMDL